MKAQSVRRQDDVADRASSRVPRESAQHDGEDGEDVDEDEDEDHQGEGSELPHESAGESEDDGDDGVSDSGSADGDDEEEEEEDEDEDDEGYDPRIVQSKDLEWTGDCRILGLNAEVSGVNKAFISGPGHYFDYGLMDCSNGNDPNAKGVYMDDYVCYYSSDKSTDGKEAYPFHWNCYKLLCRYITGSASFINARPLCLSAVIEDAERINKDVLYSTMRWLSSEFGCRLDLDYDEPDTMANHEILDDQFWEVKNGEELYVISPLTRAPLSRREIAKLRQASGLASLDSSLAVKANLDPFPKLPAEILDQIVSSLDHGDLMNLLRASWYTHSAYHGNDPFWSRKIRNTMAWFFELHEVLNSPSLAENLTNMKAVYLWAWTKTKPRFKRKGKYMGTSNRRRIWAICAQIAEEYQDMLSKPTTKVDDTTQTQADCPSFPLVSSPTTTQTEGRLSVQ